MGWNVTDRLSDALSAALRRAGLEPPAELSWEVPREEAHGDYATAVALALAKTARRPPRQVAELIRQHFPRIPEVQRVEVAGPGFVNVFLAPAWCAAALGEILRAGEAYGRSDLGKGLRVQIEFVSANPTGPLVVVNARSAAVGDSLGRILAAQGHRVYREYYVELAKAYLTAHGSATLELPQAERLDRLGCFAVERITAEQRRVLTAYGVEFDNWFSERTLRERGEFSRVLEQLRVRGYVYEAEGAVWFRSTAFGDDKDRVLVKSDGDPTYFVNDIAYHVNKLDRGFERLIDLWGPDHHGHVPRMQAALKALGYPEGVLDALIVQLVSLLREGQPVRMSKRMGEFVTMEELIGEVGRDAARFTFLTRRHDSPLDFDLEVATRQSAELGVRVPGTGR